jgi:hypothetical protein
VAEHVGVQAQGAGKLLLAMPARSTIALECHPKCRWIHLRALLQAYPRQRRIFAAALPVERQVEKALAHQTCRKPVGSGCNPVNLSGAGPFGRQAPRGVFCRCGLICFRTSQAYESSECSLRRKPFMSTCAAPLRRQLVHSAAVVHDGCIAITRGELPTNQSVDEPRRSTCGFVDSGVILELPAPHVRRAGAAARGSSWTSERSLVALPGRYCANHWRPPPARGLPSAAPSP